MFIDNIIGDKDQGFIITRRGLYPKELCHRAGSHMVTPESAELRWFDFDSYKSLTNFFRKNGDMIEYSEELDGDRSLSIGYIHRTYEIKGLGKLIISKGSWMDDGIQFFSLNGSKTVIDGINEYTKYH